MDGPAPHTVCPNRLTTAIMDLVKQIGCPASPVFVPVKPLKFRWCLLNECFNNVKKHSSRKRGAVIYGWDITGIPAGMIEAEFHAVWKSPKGELIDITPKLYDFKRTLFLEDPAREYRGKTVPSMFQPIFPNDPLCSELVSRAKRRVEIIQKHEDPTNPNQMSLPVQVANELQGNQIRIQEILTLIRDGAPSPTELCPCEKGATYGSCCAIT